MDYAEYYVNTSRKRRTSTFIILLAVGLLLFFYALSSAGMSVFFPRAVDSADALSDYFSRTTDSSRPFIRVAFDEVVPLGVFGAGLSRDSAMYVSAGVIDGSPVLVAHPGKTELSPDELEALVQRAGPLLVRRADASSGAVLHISREGILSAFSERTGEDASVLSPVFSDVPLFLDRGEPSYAASITLLIFGAGLFLFCLVYILTVRLCPEERTAFIRRLSSLGPPEETRALLNLEMKTPVSTTDSGDITKTFIIGVRRGGFDVDFTKNLVFACAKKTPQRERVSGRTPPFAVACHFMDGRVFYLLSEDENRQSGALGALKETSPHALFSDPGSLQAEWKRNPGALIQRVKERRDGA